MYINFPAFCWILITHEKMRMKTSFLVIFNKNKAQN